MRTLTLGFLLTLVCAATLHAQTTAASTSPTPVAQAEDVKAAPTAIAAETPKDETEKPEPPCSGAISVGYVNRYMDFFNAGTITNGPHVQSELYISCTKDRVTGTVVLFASKDLSKGMRQGFVSPGDELTAGGILEVEINKLMFSANVWQIAQAPVVGSNFHSFGAAVSRKFVNNDTSIKLTLSADYFRPSNKHGLKPGLFVAGVADYETPVLIDQLTLQQQLRLTYDVHGAYGFQPKSWLYYSDTGLKVGIGKGWSVTPRLMFGGAFSDPDRPFTTSVGVKVSKEFSF